MLLAAGLDLEVLRAGLLRLLLGPLLLQALARLLRHRLAGGLVSHG
ncbi:hypothetical protein [Ornithinimicrobium kibberense]